MQIPCQEANHYLIRHAEGKSYVTLSPTVSSVTILFGLCSLCSKAGAESGTLKPKGESAGRVLDTAFAAAR